MELSDFSRQCQKGLKAGKSPLDIVCEYFRKKRDPFNEQNMNAMFLFLQFIERQVVLFDALEDAAFTEAHDMKGQGTLAPLAKTNDQDLNSRKIHQLLKHPLVRIVLTAHPTQFYPNTILGLLSDMIKAIRKDDLDAINDLLIQMGYTSFNNREKPTPIDEAESLIWFLSRNFYPMLPEVDMNLRKITESTDPLNKNIEPSIELGFWAGSDRDGNPFVNTNTTLRVAGLLKQSILELYEQDLLKLKKRITFPDVLDTLNSIEDKLRACLLSTSLSEVLGEKKNTCFQNRYQHPDELISDLKKVYTIVNKKYKGHYAEKVGQLLHKVRMFGFHFASMDIRQDSRIVHETLIELFNQCSKRRTSSEKKLRECINTYEQLDEQDQIKVLEKVLALNAPGIELDQLPPLSIDTVDIIRRIPFIQQENGEKGMHRFIISMASRPIDLLELMTVCHLSGLNLKTQHLDLIPLFETIDDLESSRQTMESLYQSPIYMSYLERQNRQQIIMLGFSDGTKDGGYVEANWAIYRCKEALSQISKKHRVKLTFFDGRGGPPARGGGNTHKFYRAMGKNISHDQIQLTIQGQTISSKFGSHSPARFNFEQLLSAVMEANLEDENKNNWLDEDRNLMDNLAKISHQKYLSLKHDKGFIPFLQEVTPLNFYQDLNFSSRPVKRKKSNGFSLQDLRAIPYVGSWTQVKLNILGYYGLGEALEKLEQQGKMKSLQNFYRRSLFFRTLIQNAMMSLCKSNLELTAYLKKDKKHSNLWNEIERETIKTKKYLLLVSKDNELLEHDPVNRESISKREDIILPLTVIQQAALTTLRTQSGKKDTSRVKSIEKLVSRCMAACINAARNSV